MNIMRRKHLKLKTSITSGTKFPERFDEISEKSVSYSFLWISKNNYGKRFLQIFATICYVLTNTTQVITLILARNNQDKLFKCASVLAFCSMGMLKQISLYANSDSWKTIIKRIRKLETEQLDQSLNNEVEYESDLEENAPGHINRYTKRFRLMSSILFRLYNSTGVIYIISPFIEYGLRILSDQECAEYPHILPGWSPFDRISLIGYFITVFCEIIAAVYCVQVHIAFDTIAVGIIIFVCGQFNYLIYCSERIGGKGRSCYMSKRRDARALQRIKDCHYLHGVLVESIRDLNKLVKNVLGLYFAVATVTLGFIAVQINSENLSITQSISLFQYMLATLIQLFLFCSFGNDLVYESSIGMGEGLYGAAYWCLSPKVRRQLLILGNGIMKSQKLQAGAFFLLDMPSFIQILRTAYSYYAVIREKTD